MKSAKNATDSPIINSTLDELRSIIRRYLSIRGLLLLAIWFLAFFWIAGLLDYLPVLLGAEESPRAVRVTFLVLGALGLLWIGIRYLLSPIFVRWSNRTIALLIERRYPEFRSTLVTSIENHALSDVRATSTLAQGWHIESDPQLVARIRQAAETQLKSVDVDEVMNWQPVQRLSGAFAAMLVVTLLLLFAIPSWSLLWSKRLFALSNEAWPRKTALSVEGLQLPVPNFTGETDRRFYSVPFVDGIVQVPYGQNARLLANASLSSRLVPQFCTLVYRMEDGQSGRASLRRLPIDKRKAIQPFLLDGPPLDSIHQQMSLSLRGGDVRISNLKLEVLPAIEFASVRLDVKYPTYLRQRSTSTALDGIQEYRNGLRLPEGVDVTMILQANTELADCEFHITHQGNEQSENFGRVKSDSNTIALPLGALRDNTLVELRPWGQSGHTSNDVKQYVITILKDQAPTADLRLVGIGSSVTPLARIPLEVTVQDDHDVKSVSSQLFVGEKAPLQSPIELKASQPLASEVDLRALRDQQQNPVEAGNVLMLVATVDDFYDLDQGSRVGQSSPIQLTVVTQEQLLTTLDRREIELRKRVEQIVIELTQMNQLLAKNLEKPTEAASQDSEYSIERMQLVRIQEAKIQIEKSIGEADGVANQIQTINAELVNNRIDSVDRQARLEDKVRQPLLAVIAGDMALLNAMLKDYENRMRDGQSTELDMNAPIAKNLEVIADLEQVLEGMQDIQDFNEVVDLVRNMLDKQNQLIEKSKEQQKKKALDFLKDL